MKHSPPLMRLKRTVWMLLLACTLPARAQTPSTNQLRPMSLEEAIGLAVEHNFDVQIQRYNPQISQWSLEAAYAGYDPVLFLSGRHSFSRTPGGVDAQARLFASSETENDTFTAGLSGRLPQGMSYQLSGTANDSYGTRSGFPYEIADANASAFTLTQPLLKNFWVDSTRFNIQVSKNRLKYSEHAFRFLLMQTIFAVEQTYYRLIFARENVNVQARALELAERLLAENKKRVEVGMLAPLSEKQTESQVAGNRADLIATQRLRDDQENALKTLITDKYTEWHDVNIVPGQGLVAVPATLNLQESWQNGLALRPDLAQAKLDVERDDITLRFDRNQRLPDVSLIGQYGYRGSGQEFSDALGNVRNRDNPFWYYGAQLSYPLGNLAARNNYKISQISKKQSELILRQKKQQIMSEIDDAVRQVRSAFERIEATRVASRTAQEALEAEQKLLENGKSTSFNVLQFQRDLTSARFQEIQALAEYNIALSQLALREGRTLERHKINVTVK